MKYILLGILFMTSLQSQTIFDFSRDANIEKWRIIDDGVMGGRSAGNFQLDSEGHAVFSGYVSLENNGGFSSVRYQFEKMMTSGYTHVKLRLKGDGKNYQFRIRSSTQDYYSYVKTFTTSGVWEEVTVPLNEMFPSFRGRKLDLSNYSSDSIEEVAILIANKKAEDFQLVIDKIELHP